MRRLLDLEGVYVRLGSSTALRGASLTLAAGEIVALLGPNGAGKTTLMRAALGHVPIDAGAVRLDGVDPGKLSARQRALHGAYLPQRAHAIWPISVASLVGLGRFAYGAAPDRLGGADQAAVDAAIETCGLSALRDRRMNELSGGEKVRAHLARVLAQHASLLMLDEPTAGLDPAQALGVGDIMRAHARDGGGVLFATHDIALAAQVSHRVLLLRDGAMVAQGAAEQALTAQALETAYGRRARLARMGDAFAVVFE